VRLFRAKAQDDFAAIGLALRVFISQFETLRKIGEELRAMGCSTWSICPAQAADALREGAKNPSGVCGINRGIGAGIGLGDIIANSIAINPRKSNASAAAINRQPRNTVKYCLPLMRLNY
jgi:hypothetical protein